ncbi:MAG TPA: hypothetical protein DEF85_05920 [Clostridiaceae bacterium]|jgi:hypothetical protein|nr:hypothetical protein [Clostridiaceae bacterium]HBF76495.1 hypothetical protein [Clostridiaceae bacterium]HBG38402.1 hypothetical protein [Clostridiaceae bacterium]HBN27508.1 hypothetical protein [Clostridiaceae bacterium]HBX48411.1 hypothetical protein [Clostridiaceae bacterium]
MGKLYYCKNCRAIVKEEHDSPCCENEKLMELKVGAPVNVKGSKLKGKVLKIKGDELTLVIKDGSNNKFIKEYEYDKLRKVL